MTAEELSGVVEPYEVVGPYSTWESEGISVLQVMVAEFCPTLLAAMPEMTGSAGGTIVVNVRSVDAEVMLEPSVDWTW